MKLYSKMNVGCGPGAEPSVTCVPRWTYHCHPLHTGSVWVSRDVRGNAGVLGTQGIQEEDAGIFGTQGIQEVDAGIFGNQRIQEESCPEVSLFFFLFIYFCFVFRSCFFFYSVVI